MKSICTSALVLFCFLSFGQMETANWHFGFHAWLNFQSGSPVAVPGGSVHTQWATSGISDSLGNLLFYVRGGDLIYNKNHDTMANGYNPIGGGYFGAQSSIVIRKSGSQYYVISYRYLHYLNTNPPNTFPPMFDYAIVDMNLASGQGSVISCYQPITPPGVPMMGRLTVTRHCNGKDYWLLLHKGGSYTDYPGSNEYYAYLVTSTGINANPVISSIGANGYIHIMPDASGGFERRSHKLSPNGKKLCAIFHDTRVELYDFDNSTGVVSNLVVLDSLAVPSTTYLGVIHPEASNAEFSPDGTKLYVSYCNYPYSICQFDLAAGSPSAIAASKTIISASTMTNNAYQYSLQLGLDGKIYSGDSSVYHISVINSPNAPGVLCNYVWKAITLTTTAQPSSQSSAFLPNFVTNYFEQKPVIPPVAGSVICGNANFTAPVLSAAAGYTVLSYNWNFGDAVTGGANTSTLVNPSHAFSANGTYTVKLIMNYLPCGADTLKTTIEISGLPDLNVTGSSGICSGQSALLNLSGAGSYSFNGTPTSLTSLTVQPTITTVYTVSGSDAVTGCLSSKTVAVNVSSCIGVGEMDAVIPPQLYPNPGNGVFTVHVSRSAQISIRDITGRVVYEEQHAAGGAEINLEHCATGVYFVTITQEYQQYAFKLVHNGAE